MPRFARNVGWWDLPLRRKIVVASAFIAFFVPGSFVFDKELTIYTSAPAYSNATTEQVYPVHVNHRYLRYVTSEESESLAKWRAVGPALMAIALAIIGLTLFTLRGTVRS